MINQPERERIQRLETRVRELEDALLYLSNTLRMNGVLQHPEGEPALRMHAQGRDLAEDLPYFWPDGYQEPSP